MPVPKSFFQIGDKIFVRTVSYHLVGEIVDADDDWVQLKNASWVADSGRFMNALRDGTLEEVEPVGTAFVNMSTVTDAFPWVHELPTHQK